jgi:hypothetical protein
MRLIGVEEEDMESITGPIEVRPNLTSFAAKLKRMPDKRDNRSKRHELALGPGSVVLAMMAGRAHGSSSHRFIKNKLAWLGRVLGYRGVKAVSRAQLPRILAGVDWAKLNEIVAEQFGVRIEVQDRAWYVVDGKTLRDVAGQGERVLLAVGHANRQTVAQQPLHSPKKSQAIISLLSGSMAPPTPSV